MDREEKCNRKKTQRNNSRREGEEIELKSNCLRLQLLVALARRHWFDLGAKRTTRESGEGVDGEKREREKRTLGRSVVKKTAPRRIFRRAGCRPALLRYFTSPIYVPRLPRARVFLVAIHTRTPRTRDTRIWFTPRSMLVRSRSPRWISLPRERAYDIFRKIICADDEREKRYTLSRIFREYHREICACASSHLVVYSVIYPLISGLYNIYEDISLDAGIRSQMSFIEMRKSLVLPLSLSCASYEFKNKIARTENLQLRHYLTFCPAEYPQNSLSEIRRFQCAIYSDC